MEYIETYNVNDFPNDEYNIGALENEIKSNSALDSKYLYINAEVSVDELSNEVHIYFDNELTVGEKNDLDDIVANHNINFGIEPDVITYNLPTIDVFEDITFNTPRPTPLPTLNNAFVDISVLGTGGPDLSNVTNVSFNWNLNSGVLNTFHLSTDNGQPAWWLNLRPLTTHTFGQPNPDFILQGTNIAGLDGSYWINYYEDGIVFVSKTGGFTIFLSNEGDIDYVPKEYDERYLLINSNNVFYASENKFNAYGSEYRFVKSYDEQTTTSNGYQTALTLNATNLPRGNYKIIASHRYGMSVTNNEFFSRILLNGDQLGGEFISRENRNVNRIYNQFMFVETLSDNVSINLQYRAGGGTAYISDMIIELFKVN